MSLGDDLSAVKEALGILKTVEPVMRALAANPGLVAETAADVQKLAADIQAISERVAVIEKHPALSVPPIHPAPPPPKPPASENANWPT